LVTLSSFIGTTEERLYGGAKRHDDCLASEEEARQELREKHIIEHFNLLTSSNSG
jgi:hypothetical protein